MRGVVFGVAAAVRSNASAIPPWFVRGLTVVTPVRHHERNPGHDPLYSVVYAEILCSMGFLLKSTEVMKFVSHSPPAHQGIGTCHVLAIPSIF